MAVTPDHVPALAPPAEPARPRVLLVGTALAAAATVMLFVGLIGIYVVLRAEVIATGERWLPAGVEIPLSSPNMAMVTLLMSVVTMHWALAALGNADRRNAFVALGLSILLAAAFVNSTIFLYTQPTDLRKGFDGLSGIVRSEFAADPLDGSLFLFINRRRDRLKILHFDGTGYWLYYKLLEAGTFEVIASEGQCARIDSTQLAMLLGGVSLASVKRRKRYQRAS